MFARLPHPYLLLVLTTLFWSGNMVIGRAIRDQVPPFSLAFWRWTIALALVLPLALPHLRAQGPLPFGAIVPPAWDVYLPTSLEGDTSPSELSEAGLGGGAPIPGIYTSAYRHVSGYIFRDNEQVLTGCTNGAPGTHSVFIPDEAESRLFGDIPHEVSRDLVDTKGANCTSYLLAQAFCLWDGGRLQTREELEAAWGPATYPWGDAPWPFGPGSGTYFGNRFPWATDQSLRASGSPFAPGPM